MTEESPLNTLKEMLGYDDSQWEIWMSNPKNLLIAKNVSQVRNYKIEFEITKSIGCAAGHRVGDKIFFSGSGMLLCKENPDQICSGLLGPMSSIAMEILDRICSGEDPTKIAFNHIHCPDVGPEYGGWGEVIAEMKVKRIQE